MNIPDLKELMEAGLHFGHRPTAWHPKMSEFIYGQKNGVHIIDLEKTKKMLGVALEFVKKVASENKQILFVGTKIQAKEIIKKYAKEVNMPYINERWLGGTLTNFKVINGLVKKLKKLEDQAKDEDYEKKYTKKERHEFKIEIERLKKMVEGIRNMDSLPAAVFIVSARDEKTAVREALRKKIPSIAICDTNANPTKITYPIPSNDDAIKSIEVITKLVTGAIEEGKKEKQFEEEEKKKKEGESEEE